MTATIKTFENKAKEFQKKADKSDCYATGQPWLRKVQKLEGIIKAAKNLEKEIKTAEHNLEALTNTVNQLVDDSEVDVRIANARVLDMKAELKIKTDKIEIAEMKTKLAGLNEALVKAKETLKKVKAEKAEKTAEYKAEVEKAKAALKKFLAEHESELED